MTNARMSDEYVLSMSFKDFEPKQLELVAILENSDEG